MRRLTATASEMRAMMPLSTIEKGRVYIWRETFARSKGLTMG